MSDDLSNEELLTIKQNYIDALEKLDKNNMLLQIQKRPIKKLVENKIAEIDEILEKQEEK